MAAVCLLGACLRPVRSEDPETVPAATDLRCTVLRALRASDEAVHGEAQIRTRVHHPLSAKRTGPLARRVAVSEEVELSALRYGLIDLRIAPRGDTQSAPVNPAPRFPWQRMQSPHFHPSSSARPESVPLLLGPMRCDSSPGYRVADVWSVARVGLGPDQSTVMIRFGIAPTGMRVSSFRDRTSSSGSAVGHPEAHPAARPYRPPCARRGPRRRSHVGPTAGRRGGASRHR